MMAIRTILGVVREVSRRIFDIDVVMRVQERKQEELDNGRMAEHVVFNISMVSECAFEVSINCFLTNQIDNRHSASSLGKSLVSRSQIDIGSHEKLKEMQADLSFLTLTDFVRAFPYHLCFNRQLVIEHVGVAIKQR